MTEESFSDIPDDFLKEFDLTEEDYAGDEMWQPLTEELDNDTNSDMYTNLFDMSTVQGVDKTGTIIQSEMITVPRVVFSNSKKLCFTEDTMISYIEVEPPKKKKIIQTSMSDNALALHLRKGCGHDKSYTEHYMVPSLRLNVEEDKEYIEPVRDRNKIWTLDSQRDMLTGETPEATLKEKRALKLGKYPKLPPNPTLQWSPVLQTLLRKRRITRTAIVISDTHCFVDIYGLGVSGRVLAPGAPTSRLLLIEAYSVWDSTKYSMQVAVPLLKSLLVGQEHLFLPGKKMQLMKALLRLLYFEYTISYEEEQVVAPSDRRTSVDSRSVTSSRRHSVLSRESDSGNRKVNNQEQIDFNCNISPRDENSHENSKENAEDDRDEAIDSYATSEASLSSLLHRPGSKKRRKSNSSRSSRESTSVQNSRAPSRAPGDSSLMDDNVTRAVTRTYRVTHLDKFSLPNTFPQNIADIIRVNSTKTELLDMNCPKLIQHLKISPIVRENGPIVRRREAEEKARLNALEEERLRREWAAIPKRYKGFYAAATRRKYGKWLIMSLYRMPKKPTILVVKGFCPIECVNVPHFLDLKLLGKIYGVKTPPMMWTEQTIKEVLATAARELKLQEGDDRLAVLISHPVSSGPAVQLGPHKSCIGFENRRSVMVERRKYLPAREPLIPDIPLYENRQYSYNVPKIGRRSSKKRRLYTGECPNNHMKHRRDIGKSGIRIMQRAKKIGHAYGIWTLYMTSIMNTGAIVSFDELESEINEKKYGNQVVPPHLAPNFEITLEIYFPINPTFCARNVDFPIEYGENATSSPTVLKFVLTRRDLCRLIHDKRLLRYCLRIGHGFGFEDASEEEVMEMEHAWAKLTNNLLERCRWQRGSRSQIKNPFEVRVEGELSTDEKAESNDQSTLVAPRPILDDNKCVTAYTEKVAMALQVMNTYAYDVSSRELLRSPEKMKNPLPIMKGSPLPPPSNDQLVDAFDDDYVGPTVDFSDITGDSQPLKEEPVVEETKAVNEEAVTELEECIALDNSNELVLSLPLCIFNKTCRICSEVVRRPNVFLHIMVWQHNCELGIVAFDPELNDIYFVRPSQSQQKILSDELEPAGVTEISINMSVFMMSLIYEEKQFDLETGKEVVVETRENPEKQKESDNDSLFESSGDSESEKNSELNEGTDEVQEVEQIPPRKTRIQGYLRVLVDIPGDEEDFADEEVIEDNPGLSATEEVDNDDNTNGEKHGYTGVDGIEDNIEFDSIV